MTATAEDDMATASAVASVGTSFRNIFGSI